MNEVKSTNSVNVRSQNRSGLLTFRMAKPYWEQGKGTKEEKGIAILGL
uniref:Uncharacterized protein n=1 Tax=Arundo donax TaxID=35708 RepID=A0A0A9FLR7_ARUDO